MMAMPWNTAAKALVGLSLAAILAGCNKTTTPAVTNSVTSVTVTPATATLTVGGTTTLTASVVTKGTASNAVAWKSDKLNIATVDASGKVTAVAAGTANITATSTFDTTKVGKSVITVNAVVPPAFTPVKINFQPAASATPAGYTADSGAAFNATSGIGWVTQASASAATPTPLDVSAYTRNRGVTGVSAEQNTFASMQFPAGSNGGINSDAAYEYKVPNGKYSVTVSVGDPSYTDSIHAINIEGQAAFTPFTPTTTALFKTATVTANVTDGYLTVDAIGGTNTKINYLTIDQAN